MFVSTTLDDSECDSIGFRMTDLVIGMDEIDDTEFIRDILKEYFFLLERKMKMKILKLFINRKYHLKV